MKKLLIVLTALGLSLHSFGQDDPNQNELGGSLNRLNYAVPFLTIAPDSRAGAMGDVGVATSPDVYSMHWNPAKYAFIDGNMGASISYVPWLRKLVDDINLANLTFYKRLDNKQVIAASLLYFSLGDIKFTDDKGDPIKTHKPNEFSIDAAYSRLFSDHFSGSIAFRYIRSDISGGVYNATSGQSSAGNSYAADVSFYYENDIDISARDSKLSFGLNVSNIGSKLSYTDEDEQFLPTNLKLGGALKINLDEYNSFTFAADINKFLIPTPPNRVSDTIVNGKDDNVSVPVGIFQSFYDGYNGGTFKEEIHELMYSVGVEYWYANQFAVRGGYFHEHQSKGNRKYYTVGLGLKLNVFGFDFAYMIPKIQNHPLENTVRFSISFDIDAFNDQRNR